MLDGVHRMWLAQSGGEGGGAALDQVAAMTGGAGVIAIALLWVGHLHRTRRITWLRRLADGLGRKFNRPGWWRCR